MDDGDEINEFFDNESYEDEPMVEKDNELNDLIEKENKNVKKTVKCRPQPKLNEATLMGPKGIQALRDSFKSFKPDLTKDPVYMTKSRLDMPLTDEDFAKPRRSNRDEIIETENNEDNFAPTNRQSGSDDDENFYNKIRFPTSYGKNKEGSISNKSVLPLTNFSHVNCSPEMENDIIESALEARAVAMQKEFSRREEEELAMADEIMADFDI
ncbi:hypothetical protein DICVIV_00791 [Dictyocaulus viviparus]|uniref:Uncharacterized protein n=1 Tax=Dictyocaulus viviparus TaxID=29172 RepID=A0A0D8Y9P4_DICVI|nr:hypothetical protein DICVIV_00791 [Dictyocaulus viviparus]